MKPNWTEEEKQIVFQLNQNDYTAREIAEELVDYGYKERSGSAIRNLIGRMRKEIKNKVENNPLKSLSMPRKKGKDLLEEINSLEEGYGRHELKELEELKKRAVEEDHSHDREDNPLRNEGQIQIVTISDLHGWCYHPAMLEEVIEKYGITSKGEDAANAIVVNGDFLEMYSVSKWPKNKTVLLRHEYEICMGILRVLADEFPQVYLVRGNHEERLQRYFSANVDPAVSFLTSPDLLSRMAQGYDFNNNNEFEQIHHLPNVHYNLGQLSWFIKIGKCIFAHPSGISGVPMRTVISTAEYMRSRDEDFECLVMGHTHQQGSIVWNKRLLIEQGCGCVPMEYSAASAAKYRPQTLGYAVIYMNEEGRVDFEKSGPVYYGTTYMLDARNIIGV